MADAIECQNLIERYGELIEQRDEAHRQYCDLEIQLMLLGQQIPAEYTGALNEELDRRKRHKAIYPPSPTPPTAD